MKKRKGHYCHICRRMLPNDRFSGKGHRDHVCRECKLMPAAERQAIELADEVSGYLRQSRISEKNIARLDLLSKSSTPSAAELASTVLEVARIAPFKGRRVRILASKARGLLPKLAKLGVPGFGWVASSHPGHEIESIPHDVAEQDLGFDRDPWSDIGNDRQTDFEDERSDLPRSDNQDGP